MCFSTGVLLEFPATFKRLVNPNVSPFTLGVGGLKLLTVLEVMGAETGCLFLVPKIASVDLSENCEPLPGLSLDPDWIVVSCLLGRWLPWR